MVRDARNILLLALGVTLAACTRSTLIHVYRNVPAEGWDQSDVLSFPLDTVRHGGVYNLSIGVRTTNLYPYQKLWIVVETALCNPDTAFADTLACTFVGDDGIKNGKGTDTQQYDFHLGQTLLQQGQSGTVSVRHIMRREVVPGVSDIGIRISK